MGDGKLPTYTHFLFGSIAGVGSTASTYPLDVLKTRLQTIGKGSKERVTLGSVAKHMWIHEGAYGFYKGISASLLRQVTYTGLRMGLFLTLVDYYTKDGVSPNLFWKGVFGTISGGLGGISGLPADVSMTRMSVDNVEPPERRRNYRNVIDAINRIHKEEGFVALFRGFNATLVRCIIMNVSQLLSYVETKRFLLQHNITGDNTYCHIASSVISAFVTTVSILPTDMAKIRLQNMALSPNARHEYHGMLDVWAKVIKKEGVFALWKGFVPLFVRNGPQFVVFFYIYENLVYMYRTHIMTKK